MVHCPLCSDLAGICSGALDGPPAYGDDAERLAFACQALMVRLGARPFAAATTHGEAMAPEAVVDFAAAELRRALRTAVLPG